MGKHERRAYLAEIRGRYLKADRAGKARILDEFCAVWNLEMVTPSFAFEPRICDLCPDTSAAPRFLWGRVPPGRRQFIAHRLIHMGDRHDSVVASIEETGSA